MTLEQAKTAFPDYFIKDRGYHGDKRTQFLFKSEVRKTRPIICLFNGVPHLLQENVRTLLKEYIESNFSLELPKGIKYNSEQSKELFSIPIDYFLNKSTEYNPVVLKDYKTHFAENPIKPTPPVSDVIPDNNKAVHETYAILKHTLTEGTFIETTLSMLRNAMKSKSGDDIDNIIEFLKKEKESYVIN